VGLVTLAHACACGRLAGRPTDALPKNIPFTIFFVLRAGRSGRTMPPCTPPVTDYLFLCHLFLLVLFPLPKLSVEASLFVIWEGAKNKTAGEHDCSFGRGSEHLLGLLVLSFWPALGLEGQLEGQLFFGAGSKRLANRSAAFVGSAIVLPLEYKLLEE